MNLQNIVTSRQYNTLPFWDLVFEWEDIFSEKLGIKFYYEKKYINNRYIRHTPFLPQLLQTSKPSFRFDINTSRNSNANNKKSIIPCIIDFFLKDEEELNTFYHRYSKNKIVFISSLEAYNFLKSCKCPLNIQHMALSISDKYKIEPTTKFVKPYDLVMMGRQNTVLQKFVEQYAANHTAFKYVYRVLKDGIFNYFTSDGQSLGNINTREKYISLMRQARVGLYSTPGIDGGETRTNGYNQVTPRFLELVASGCHVIARYSSNPDTDYYELNLFSSNIQNYAQFEEVMNKYLSTEVDMKQYSEYLSKHYTSVRCKELERALLNL